MAETEQPKYVYDLLDQISQENNFSDYSIQIKNGSEIGDGFTSTILSITICENNSEKKLCLVCKLAPLNKNRRKDFLIDHLYDHEAAFYNKVVPSFEKFQAEKNLSKDDQFLAYPKCYVAIADDETERYVIILEDLRMEGFRLWNKSKPASIENVRLAMREIGKFHGISYAMKRQKPKEYAEFEQLTDIMGPLFKNMQGVFESSLDRAIELIKCEKYKDILRDMKINQITYFESLFTAKSPFAVVSHGKFTLYTFAFESNSMKTQIIF